MLDIKKKNLDWKKKKGKKIKTKKIFRTVSMANCYDSDSYEEENNVQLNILFGKKIWTKKPNI